MCDAVAFAHARGVLHRDLKPANIMVGPFGEVLVMDWGLAKILQEPAGEPAPLAGAKEQATPAGRTAHGVVMGTAGFMSPEQAQGNVDKIDVRSDVYSLGAILKFLVLPQESKVLAAICAKAAAEEQSNRYAGVPELAADVSAYLDGLAVAAYRENLWERAGRFVKRHRAAILLIAAYLVMRIVMLLVFRR
jgi:serine/threonine protein kinase